MKMLTCSKRQLTDGMIKEFSKENLIFVIKYYYIGLVSDFLQENYSLNGKELLLWKKFIGLVLSRLIISKALIHKW